jgi:hypothetical protein
MKHCITLGPADSLEIEGNGLKLSFTLGDKGGLLSKVMSQQGGKRIMIRQQEQDHRSLLFLPEEMT